ncbi:MAG TPA: hypothetical protein PLL33_14560, partial [Paracoccus sp. (in: a-proteobacteria)]|nr:hypothetical protein [Paracoccus sp. (in: a-proteobacteria)]
MSRPDPVAPAALATLRCAIQFRHALGAAILAMIPVLAGAQAPAPRLDFAPAEMALARAVASDPGLAAWYGTNGLQAIFAAPEAAARRQAVIAAVGGASGHGLPPARYGVERLRALDAA